MQLKKLGLIVCLAFSLTACDKFSGSNLLDSVLKTGEPYFVIAFNKTFAKRFSLFETKAITLSDNLQAMAVEINKVNDHYICDLHLYIDDQLDIYQLQVGSYFSAKALSEYFFAQEYNDEDLQANEYVLNNHMRLRFNATLQAAHSFTSTLSYKRIHSNFLPDLTIVTINMDYGLFNRKYYPADIWIQKQNIVDYLVGNDGPEGVSHPENNQRFPIPMTLVDQVQPYIEIADKYNTERL